MLLPTKKKSPVNSSGLLESDLIISMANIILSLIYKREKYFLDFFYKNDRKI